MAKKKSKQQQQVAAEDSTPEPATDGGDNSDAAETSSSYVEDELELLQVDLGDMVKMKQVLDEAVAGAVLEHVEEDYHWDNIKLIIMTVACAFAMTAQFAPLPFPESRPVLGFCGAAYFILSGVLQLVTTFVDKDTILLTKSDIKSSNKDLQKYGIRVRSDFPRFSEWYTVILEFNVPQQQQPKGGGDSSDSSKTTQPLMMVEQTWSVGQFFDKEGYFDEVGVIQEVDALFDRFEQQKYDDKNSLDEKKKQ